MTIGDNYMHTQSNKYTLKRTRAYAGEREHPLTRFTRRTQGCAEKTTTRSPDGHFSPLFPSLIKYQVSRGAITGAHTLSFLYMSSRFKPVTHFHTQTQLFNDQCRNLDPLSNTQAHSCTHIHTRRCVTAASL